MLCVRWITLLFLTLLTDFGRAETVVVALNQIPAPMTCPNAHVDFTDQIGNVQTLLSHLQCDESYRENNCEKFKASLPADRQNRLISCNQSEALPAPVSAFIGCAQGGVNFVVNTVTGLIALPGLVANFMADSAAFIRQCESDPTVRRALLNPVAMIYSPLEIDSMVNTLNCDAIAANVRLQITNITSQVMEKKRMQEWASNTHPNDPLPGHLKLTSAEEKFMALNYGQPAIDLIGAIWNATEKRAKCFTFQAKSELVCQIAAEIGSSFVGVGLLSKAKLATKAAEAVDHALGITHDVDAVVPDAIPLPVPAKAVPAIIEPTAIAPAAEVAAVPRIVTPIQKAVPIIARRELQQSNDIVYAFQDYSPDFREAIRRLKLNTEDWNKAVDWFNSTPYTDHYYAINMTPDELRAFLKRNPRSGISYMRRFKERFDNRDHDRARRFPPVTGAERLSENAAFRDRFNLSGIPARQRIGLERWFAQASPAERAHALSQFYPEDYLKLTAAERKQAAEIWASGQFENTRINGPGGSTALVLRLRNSNVDAEELMRLWNDPKFTLEEDGLSTGGFVDIYKGPDDLWRTADGDIASGLVSETEIAAVASAASRVENVTYRPHFNEHIVSSNEV